MRMITNGGNKKRAITNFEKRTAVRNRAGTQGINLQ
jgi:hypothetical protein